ncbi:hypothetical protein AYO40_00420 [Planctomycetaceae bacterium SCGC AG-212-D15]|nr:hypothetical protein AYO40_00420 [Planctomycetaceae bacterium SCGC AG-212-D15]
MSMKRLLVVILLLVGAILLTVFGLRHVERAPADPPDQAKNEPRPTTDKPAPAARPAVSQRVGATPADAKVAADDATGGGELYRLAAICEQQDPAAMPAALAELAKRQDAWAYDLLVRFGQSHQAFAVKNPVALAVAWGAGHYSSTPEAKIEFEKNWKRASSDRYVDALIEDGPSGVEKTQLTEKAAILDVFVHRYVERPTGLTWHVWPSKARGAVAAVVKPAVAGSPTSDEVNLLRERYRLLFGQLEAAPADAVTKKTLERIDKALVASTRLDSPELLEAFHAAEELLVRSDASFAQALDARLARLYSLARKPENQKRWRTLFVNEDVARALALILRVSDKLGKPAPSSRNGFEDVVLMALREMGNELPTFAKLVELQKELAEASLPKTEVEKRVAPLVKYNVAFHACTDVIRLTPAGFSRGSDPAAGLDYTSLPQPFASFVAEVRAREGDKDAASYLRSVIQEKLENYQQRCAELGKTRPKDSLGEVNLLSEEIRRILLVIRPERTHFAEISRALDKAYRSKLPPNTPTLADSLGYSSILRDAAPFGDDRVSKGIGKLRDQYARREIDLGYYLAGMGRLGALDDSDLYKAFQADTEGRKTIAAEVFACKLIGFRGQPLDLPYLYSMWNHGNDETREAIIAAAERRSYRIIVDDFIRLYRNNKHPDIRLLITRLIAGLAQPQDADFLLERLGGEKDERCLEFLGTALLNLSRDKKHGRGMIERLAETLKREDYGARWFYVASVLYALNAEKPVYVPAFADKEERARAVDTLVRSIRNRN